MSPESWPGAAAAAPRATVSAAGDRIQRRKTDAADEQEAVDVRTSSHFPATDRRPDSDTPRVSPRHLAVEPPSVRVGAADKSTPAL